MTCQQGKSSWIESRKMGTDAVDSNPGGIVSPIGKGRGTRTTAQPQNPTFFSHTKTPTTPASSGPTQP
jgi:hypothetical protein